ncbi:MAG: ABC transporter permease [Candidatus Aminicenantes bacterium]|nr:ABC transporter permease [Candidatus Aminicenantes bacterium]
MIKHCLKVALRIIKRQKGYFFLNFLGLVIGLAVTLVISLYIIDDLTFDKFHDKGDRIYRILSVGVKRGTINSITAGALVEDVRQNVPGVQNAVRIAPGGNRQIGPVNTKFDSREDETFLRARAVYAEPQFFEMFSFNILKGESGEALRRPESVFLTPEKAEALFGQDDPLGKPLAVRGMKNARVAGIVEPPPSNSHIRYEMILPLIPEENPRFFNSWDTLAIRGYVLLEDSADISRVTAVINENALKNGFPEIFEARLQPLADIHLGSSDHFYDTLNEGRSDRVVFYTMTFVGILVLLVACFNFVNLTTSRASKRALEVGLRKVAGSNKRQLTGQFLGESVLTTALAFVCSLALVDITLPFLNNIMKKSLSLSFPHDVILLVFMLTAAVLVGILSGLYPSLVISSFKPIQVLKGEFRTGKKGAFLRKTLVVCQFAVTTVLVISVFCIIAQIKYLKSIDLGYNRSHVLVIPSPLRQENDILKQRILSLPSVVSAGRIDSTPAPNFWRFELIREGAERSDNITASRFVIDEDVLKTLEISLLEGRSFSKELASDASDTVIVNETLVKKMDYENSVGRTLRYYDESTDNVIVARQIIGVIKDFHYVTARQKSEPMIFFYKPRSAFLLMVRIAPGRIDEALPRIKEVYEETIPDRAFQYEFLDDSFNQQFIKDQDFTVNISLFAGLAVFVACLGLVGLVAYTIEQRKKEVAIRKVLGSGERTIYSLLSLDLLKWVLFSNLIAWPLGYFAGRAWLNDFVFRVPFQPWTFGLASLGVLVIALLTISLQTMRAVRLNPAAALREEG